MKPFMVEYMKENHHNLLMDEMIERMKKDEENQNRYFILSEKFIFIIINISKMSLSY